MRGMIVQRLPTCCRVRKGGGDKKLGDYQLAEVSGGRSGECRVDRIYSRVVEGLVLEFCAPARPGVPDRSTTSRLEVGDRTEIPGHAAAQIFEAQFPILERRAEQDASPATNPAMSWALAGRDKNLIEGSGGWERRLTIKEGGGSRADGA